MTLRVTIVQPGLCSPSETFLSAHAECLPADVSVVHHVNGSVPAINQRAVLSQSLSNRALRKAARTLTGKAWNWEITAGYLGAFRRQRADVVLAEYGPTGVAVMDACRIAKIPLVVHFHGYDASMKRVLEKFGEAYRRMFAQASAVVAVSRAMRARLLKLGADPARTHLNVYGIDCENFEGADPAQAPAVFLAVGRFVEKKAPYLTILAFAEALRHAPDARLRMIGEGQLLGVCKDLARALDVERSIDFLGVQPHDVVAREMRQARAFVQHSIEASTGDCEGTPVAVLEAGASGLPVISTNHAGIPDVVVDGQTGFIVEERDVSGMAERMIALATDPPLAARMGAAARRRIADEFTMQQSINRLYAILAEAAGKTGHEISDDIGVPPATAISNGKTKVESSASSA